MGRYHKKRTINNGVVIVIISIVLVILSANLFLRSQFCASENILLEIQATAEKNSVSYGRDVRIKSIKADKAYVEMSNLELSGTWTWNEEGKFIEILDPSQPETLSIYLEDIHKLEIEFLQNIGSGLVEIYVNHNLVETIDVYDETYGTVVSAFYQNNEISFTEHPVYTAMLFLLFLCLGFLIMKGSEQFRVCTVNERQEILKKVRFDAIRLSSLWGIGVLLSLLFVFEGQGNSFRYKCIFFLCLGVVYVVLAALDLGIRLCLRKKSAGKSILIMIGKWIFVLSVPLISFVLLEEMQGHDWIHFKFSALAGNLVIFFLIYFLLFLFWRNSRRAIFSYIPLVMVASLGNYFVLQYRGSALLPADLLAAGTAARVAGNYEFMVDFRIIICLWLLLGILGLAAVISPIKVKWRLKDMAVLVILNLSLMEIVLFHITGSVGYWDTESIYASQGLVLSFVLEMKHMKVESPDGYSVEEIQKLAEQISGQEETDTPNLIVIMDESFADLEVEGLSEDPLAYIHGMKENVVKGDLYVSTIGGGTSNTEYEFLTNNTMAFFPSGSIPYVQYGNSFTSSLASQLTDLGYVTAAVHPFESGGYSRDRVYPRLGFQQIYFQEDFENPEYIRDYISDRSSFEKVIQIYKNSTSPVFIFNVTMQNHSSYQTGGFTSEVTFTGSENYPEVEQYLTLVKKTDQAFKELIEYFSEVSEPTAVIFFGDHRPALPDNFYEELMQKESEEYSLMAKEKTERRVPFVIWTNFDIQEQENVQISANYLSAFLLELLGMDMTGYQKYLMELYKSVPVMNLQGYLDNKGNWHGYYEKTQYTESLNEYERIQYNNVFGKKQRVTAFFE